MAAVAGGHTGNIFQRLQQRSDCLTSNTKGTKKSIKVLYAAILNYTFWRDIQENGFEGVCKDFLSFHSLSLQMNQKAVNIHSNKSARVLVRRATGRLVLSLVIANSCMPNSSATLACVRLFTSELRSSYGQTKRASHSHVHLWEMYSRCEHIAAQTLHIERHAYMETYRSTQKHQNKPTWNNSSKTEMVMQSKCFREIARRSVKYYIVTWSLADDNMLDWVRYIYVSKRKNTNMLNIATRCGKEQIECNMTVWICLALMCPL